MKIIKEGDELVVRIPLKQPVNNPYEDYDDLMTANLIGVIAGDECTISQLNDLSYKGDQQEGPPLIHWYGNKEIFKDICNAIGISIWVHEVCVKCDKPIYGCSTWDKGPVCYGCELEERKTNEKEQELAEELTIEFLDEQKNDK